MESWVIYRMSYFTFILKATKRRQTTQVKYTCKCTGIPCLTQFWILPSSAPAGTVTLVALVAAWSSLQFNVFRETGTADVDPRICSRYI